MKDDIDEATSRLFNRMREISIIEAAVDEINTSGELHPDTAKELIAIGINPDNFQEDPH